jgi:hypothetical protein
MMTTSLPSIFLSGQGCALPFLALRRGWEVTTWMSRLCREDREGQREAGHFLPPPFPWACCAAFVPRLTSPSPVLLCVLPPLPHFPPAPAPPSPQRIGMSAQDLCESSVYLSLPSVPSAWADQRPNLGSISSHLVFCPQLLKHNWISSTSRFSAILNQGCLLQQRQESE